MLQNTGLNIVLITLGFQGKWILLRREHNPSLWYSFKFPSRQQTLIRQRETTQDPSNLSSCSWILPVPCSWGAQCAPPRPREPYFQRLQIIATFCIYHSLLNHHYGKVSLIIYELPEKDIHKCQALLVSEANSLSESVPTWRGNTGLGRDVHSVSLSPSRHLSTKPVSL